MIVLLIVAIIGTYNYFNQGQNQVPSSGPSGSLNVAGSTTVLPMNQEWARLLMRKYSGIRISVSGGGSGRGIKAVGSGEIDVGAASRDIKNEEFNKYPDLEPFAVAKDSIAIIVHPSNPISDISLENIAGIYSGEITNFKEIGGPDMEINVYTREVGSGTRGSFEDLVLKKFDAEIYGRASVKPSNGELRAAVTRDEQGFAYISLGYLDGTIKGLSIDRIEPNIKNVKTGDYALVRNLYLITKGEPSEIEELFIKFALSPEGQAIVEEQGYIKAN